MERFVVISGCSSGGKSCLLSELQHRGFATVGEPGRRIVADEKERGGNVLPWLDLRAFLERAIKISLEDRKAADLLEGTVFFDRGLIDAVIGLEHEISQTIRQNFQDERYNRKVFMAPPWPEIFVNDDARRHNMGEAILEYDRLLVAFDQLGYETCLLPKASVEERADFVLGSLGLA